MSFKQFPSVLDDNHHYQELREWTMQYIDKHCIVRNRRMPGKAPGTTYTWMFYLRRGLFNHEFLSAVAQMFYYKARYEVGHVDFQLTGLETAATPMLAGFPLIGRALDVDMNAFVVRKDQKTYGLQNWIEGVPNERPAMIIDDLCNSSASMAKCYRILKDHNIPILPYAFSIINKVNKGVHTETREKTDMYLSPDIKVLSLFTLDDFNLFNPSH
jgi:orotate phosphoribosyltransferase